MTNKKALKSKNIYTALSPELINGYVILEGNKIKEVVTLEDAGKKPEMLEGAEILSYEDHFIMPGFCDFHTHLLSGAMLEQDGILRYTTSPEEAARYLWEKHKDNPQKKWILGGAWDPILWGGIQEPSKEVLDQYFPDTPVFLVNKECHGAWVNSKLLEVFRISRETPDPENGYYSRTPEGELGGYVHEGAFAAIQNQIYERMSDRELAEYAVSSVALANRYGITSVGDVAGVGPLREKAYDILEKENRLSVRINFYALMDDGMESIKEKMTIYQSPLLRCAGTKTFIDGTPQGYTGYMLEDYSDRPGVKGSPLVEPEEFIKRISEFHKERIPVRIHACGDAGVRLSLDAYEKAFSDQGNHGLRHSVEHIESIAEEDILRFGELGIVASVQPEHMPKYDFVNHPFHRILGRERMKYCWPFESLRRGGAVLAFGTDYPVVDFSPFRGIYRAVTRMTNEGEPQGGWNPAERVSVHNALRAYTFGGAYGAGREGELGTLEAGKLADVIVVDKNLFDYTEDREAMFDMQVLLTMVNGEIVHLK